VKKGERTFSSHPSSSREKSKEKRPKVLLHLFWGGTVADDSLARKTRKEGEVHSRPPVGCQRKGDVIDKDLQCGLRGKLQGEGKNLLRVSAFETTTRFRHIDTARMRRRKEGGASPICFLNGVEQKKKASVSSFFLTCAIKGARKKGKPPHAQCGI